MLILYLHCSLIGYAFPMQELFNQAMITACHMQKLPPLAVCLAITITIQNLTSVFDLDPADGGWECLSNVGDTVHSRAPYAGSMNDHGSNFSFPL